MNHCIRRTGRKLLLMVSTLSLVACFKPDSPPSPDFEPVESAVSAAAPQCPDLSGTYRLTTNTQESLLFSPYLLPAHQMDMVQLTRNSNDWFLYRLKMTEARFSDQVAALRSSNPQAYATWYGLITEWLQEKKLKKETSVLEGKILQIGPLPERGGLITPMQCEAFWAQVKYQDGAPIGLDDEVDDASTIETVTQLSRSKKGDLLFRYDNFGTSSFIFQSTIRTGLINSAYAKLETTPLALFEWDITERNMPRPLAAMAQSASPPVVTINMQPSAPAAPPAYSATVQRTDLPDVLVDVQQYVLDHLPAGASLTRFKLDEPSSQNAALWVSIQGETNSNKEVSDLLRAMMQHPQVENVELVSIQYSKTNKIEFDIRIKLKN